jgi:hypothetical protein
LFASLKQISFFVVIFNFESYALAADADIDICVFSPGESRINKTENIKLIL